MKIELGTPVLQLPVGWRAGHDAAEARRRRARFSRLGLVAMVAFVTTLALLRVT